MRLVIINYMQYILYSAYYVLYTTCQAEVAKTIMVTRLVMAITAMMTTTTMMMMMALVVQMMVVTMMTTMMKAVTMET